MYKRNLHTQLKVVLVLTFLLVLSLYAFPVIFGNGSGNGYCDATSQPDCPLPPGIASAETGSKYDIEVYVQEGGGYFLKANSLILALMNQVELSDLNGLDYELLKKNAGDALQNTRAACSIYSALVELAANTPYNPRVIEKLKTFDYQSFMVKNNLNREIFKKVAVYLSNGDITGMYRRILRELLVLEALLGAIYNDISCNRQPGLQLLWKSGEAFSETLLFGQYAARIFYEI